MNAAFWGLHREPETPGPGGQGIDLLLLLSFAVRNGLLPMETLFCFALGCLFFNQITHRRFRGTGVAWNTLYLQNAGDTWGHHGTGERDLLSLVLLMVSAVD